MITIEKQIERKKERKKERQKERKKERKRPCVCERERERNQTDVFEWLNETASKEKFGYYIHIK